MKRFISLAIVMAMALSLFAGCAKEETTTTTAAPAGEATTAATENVMTEAEELEAMKSEPAYEEGFKFFASGGCTSAPWVADYLGYFEEYGLKGEVYMAGDSWKEALGTNSSQATSTSSLNV